jgi:hypothetical protein
MGLTSDGFFTLMVGVAIAGTVAILWLWRLAARPRAGAVLARIGMIAVSQVLVIAAFAVLLNGYFGFYTSWSQLLGSSAASKTFGSTKAANARGPMLTITGAAPGPLAGARVRTALPPLAAGSHSLNILDINRSGYAKLAQTGELLSISINGAHTGIAASNAYVYLPPQYFQPAYAQARFPAVLAIAGYPASPADLLNHLKVPGTAAELLTQKKIKPAVYVMMDSSLGSPRDFECTNVPAGPQVETFFAQDVPLAIEHAFRVASGPGTWAAIGYSTGGYCAVKLAMMNPASLSLAVALAGYYYADQNRFTGDLYGGSTGYRELNDLDWRLTHLPAPPISVLVASSRIGENFSYPGTVAFLRLIRAPMRGYWLFLPQGGHNFASWGRELPPALVWLSQRLRPAMPRLGGAQRGGGRQPASKLLRLESGLPGGTRSAALAG